MILLKIDKNEAVQYYENKLVTHSYNVSLRLGYANALYEVGNYDDAFIEYQKILNIDPHNETALIGLEHSGKKIGIVE